MKKSISQKKSPTSSVFFTGFRKFIFLLSFRFDFIIEKEKKKKQKKDIRTEPENVTARGRHAGLNKRHSLQSIVDCDFVFNKYSARSNHCSNCGFYKNTLRSAKFIRPQRFLNSISDARDDE